MAREDSSPYDVLGVARDATQRELRSAYRALALMHHPDRPTGSAARFAELAAAYEQVATPERRAAHDRRPVRTAPPPRPAPPAAPDFSHVAATPADLDARWHDLVASYRPRRRWWPRRSA